MATCRRRYGVWAADSVLAHLVKLRDEGRVQEENQAWSPVWARMSAEPTTRK